jgi:hypothetical protein
MYYLRAKAGIKDTSIPSLRAFYEKNKYEALKNEDIMPRLHKLVDFWVAVGNQDEEKFTKDTLKKLYVLMSAPNGMWEYLVAVYILSVMDTSEAFGEKSFNQTKFKYFLEAITAFIFARAIIQPGVSSLRGPVFEAMINLYKHEDISFANYKFDTDQIRTAIENYQFSNQRNITRSILTWYAFSFKEQNIINRQTSLDIEHIYSRKRQKMESGLTERQLESLGNKVLLEKAINIKASDYRFEDKKEFYLGRKTRSKNSNETQISEIKNEIVKLKQFEKLEVENRNKKIIDGFMGYLNYYKLLN